MDEFSKGNLEQLNKDIEKSILGLHLEDKRSRYSYLEKQSIHKDLWKDRDHAKQILKEMELLKNEIDQAEKLNDDSLLLLELYNTSDEEDKNLLSSDYFELKKRFEKFQTLKFLNGKYDQEDAILSIHAGQGGTEANDWANMLMRMYMRYCEREGYKTEIIHIVPGNETGISTSTIQIEGKYAFGKLRKETGTHRLVRISSFNSQGLRQTSFAGIEVIPVIPEESDEIEIRNEDIEFKAVRAGGAGGQHVNKTSSAVQITHIPTGITVHSSEQRDQFQNKKAALKILRAKLWQIEEEKRDLELKNIKGEHKIAGWGNQIRNYILHPYKLVKDLRTKQESTNPEDILDGNLEEFVEAQIRLK